MIIHGLGALAVVLIATAIYRARKRVRAGAKLPILDEENLPYQAQPESPFPAPAYGLGAGSIVPPSQAPELTRNERRRYAKLHKKLQQRVLK